LLVAALGTSGYESRFILFVGGNRCGLGAVPELALKPCYGARVVYSQLGGPLGLVVGGQLAWQRRPWWQWLVAWGLLFTLVVLAEAGQHFEAHRSFDLGDIAWGGIGAAVGLALVAVLPVGYWLLRRASSPRQPA
jgi:hypothetical protein